MTPETSTGIAEAANATREPWTWQTVEEHLVRMGLSRLSDSKFRNDDVLVELGNAGDAKARSLHIFTREAGAGNYATTNPGVFVRPEEVIPLVMTRTGLNAQSTAVEHAPVPTIPAPNAVAATILTLVSCEYAGGKKSASAKVILDVRQGDDVRTVETAGEGNGSVAAVINAINAALEQTRQDLRRISLTYFHIAAASDGWDASGDAQVKITDGEKRAEGRGENTDIILASAEAYVAAVNTLYAL